MHQCKKCKVNWGQGMLKVVGLLNSAEALPVLLDVLLPGYFTT